MINSPLFNVPSLSLGFIIFRIHFLKYSASWCFLKMLAGSSTPVLLDITLSLWESQNSWGNAMTQPCAYYSVMSNSLKPMDCSTPGFSVHGDSPDRILKWVAMPSSWESSQPKDQTQVSRIVGGFFTIAKSCPTLVTPWTMPATLLCPWDSPGKNTGVGCHSFLLVKYN